MELYIEALLATGSRAGAMAKVAENIGIWFPSPHLTGKLAPAAVQLATGSGSTQSKLDAIEFASDLAKALGPKGIGKEIKKGLYRLLRDSDPGVRLSAACVLVSQGKDRRVLDTISSVLGESRGVPWKALSFCISLEKGLLTGQASAETCRAIEHRVDLAPAMKRNAAMWLFARGDLYVASCMRSILGNHVAAGLTWTELARAHSPEKIDRIVQDLDRRLSWSREPNAFYLAVLSLLSKKRLLDSRTMDLGLKNPSYLVRKIVLYGLESKDCDEPSLAVELHRIEQSDPVATLKARAASLCSRNMSDSHRTSLLNVALGPDAAGAVRAVMELYLLDDPRLVSIASAIFQSNKAGSLEAGALAAALSPSRATLSMLAKMALAPGRKWMYLALAQAMSGGMYD